MNHAVGIETAPSVASTCSLVSVACLAKGKRTVNLKMRNFVTASVQENREAECSAEAVFVYG